MSLRVLFLNILNVAIMMALGSEPTCKVEGNYNSVHVSPT